MAYEFKIHDYAFAYVIRETVHENIFELIHTSGGELINLICLKVGFLRTRDLFSEFPWFIPYMGTRAILLLESLPALPDIERRCHLVSVEYYIKDRSVLDICKEYLNPKLVNLGLIPSHIIDMVWAVEKTCCVCIDVISREDFTVTECGHNYCFNCLEKISHDSCAVCRRKFRD